MEPTFIKEWLPVFVIGAVTVMIYMLFRILSTRVIRFILNKLPDDADQNIATALYKPGRLAIISGGIYLMVQKNEEAPMFKKSHILGLFDNATAAGKNNPLFLTKFPQGLCFLLAKGCLAFPK